MMKEGALNEMRSYLKKKTKKELIRLAMIFIASRDYVDFVELADYMKKYMPVTGDAGIRFEGSVLWWGASDDFSMMVSVMLQNRIVSAYPAMPTYYVKKYEGKLPQKLLSLPIGQCTQKYNENDLHWLPCVLSTKYPNEWLNFLEEFKPEGLKNVR